MNQNPWEEIQECTTFKSTTDGTDVQARTIPEPPPKKSLERVAGGWPTCSLNLGISKATE